MLPPVKSMSAAAAALDQRYRMSSNSSAEDFDWTSGESNKQLWRCKKSSVDDEKSNPTQCSCGGTSYCRKQKIGNDVYLSDRTVAVNDPRLMQAFTAMTRIRHRTGFDSTLVRSKAWAKKTNRDLTKGLAKMDEIVDAQKRYEQGYKRDMDVERNTLNSRMLRASSLPTLKGRVRSKSVSVVADELLASRVNLYRSLSKLDSYVSDLEAQGGFIKSIPETSTGSATSVDSSNTNASDHKADDVWQNEDTDELVSFVARPFFAGSQHKNFSRRHSVHFSAS